MPNRFGDEVIGVPAVNRFGDPSIDEVKTNRFGDEEVSVPEAAPVTYQDRLDSLTQRDAALEAANPQMNPFAEQVHNLVSTAIQFGPSMLATAGAIGTEGGLTPLIPAAAYAGSNLSRAYRRWVGLEGGQPWWNDIRDDVAMSVIQTLGFGTPALKVVPKIIQELNPVASKAIQYGADVATGGAVNASLDAIYQMATKGEVDLKQVEEMGGVGAFLSAVLKAPSPTGRFGAAWRRANMTAEEKAGILASAQKAGAPVKTWEELSKWMADKESGVRADKMAAAYRARRADPSVIDLEPATPAKPVKSDPLDIPEPIAERVAAKTPEQTLKALREEARLEEDPIKKKTITDAADEVERSVQGKKDLDAAAKAKETAVTEANDAQEAAAKAAPLDPQKVAVLGQIVQDPTKTTEQKLEIVENAEKNPNLTDAEAAHLVSVRHPLENQSQQEEAAKKANDEIVKAQKEAGKVQADAQKQQQEIDKLTQNLTPSDDLANLAGKAIPSIQEGGNSGAALAQFQASLVQPAAPAQPPPPAVEATLAPTLPEVAPAPPVMADQEVTVEGKKLVTDEDGRQQYDALVAQQQADRNKIIGKDYAGPPNSVVIQPRNLDSDPIGDGKPVVLPVGQTLEETAAMVHGGYAKLINSVGGSMRESVVMILGPDGKKVAQLRWTPEGMEVVGAPKKKESSTPPSKPWLYITDLHGQTLSDLHDERVRQENHLPTPEERRMFWDVQHLLTLSESDRKPSGSRLKSEEVGIHVDRPEGIKTLKLAEKLGFISDVSSSGKTFRTRKTGRSPHELLPINVFEEYFKDAPAVEDQGPLYHVTFTKNIPSIKKGGIKPLQTSNWRQGGAKGNRYGTGGIYAFNSLSDAYKWALKMDWEFNGEWGTGKISILKVNDGAGWEAEQVDPISQSGAAGDWLVRRNGVPAKSIGESAIIDKNAMKDRGENLFSAEKPPPAVEATLAPTLPASDLTLKPAPKPIEPIAEMKDQLVKFETTNAAGDVVEVEMKASKASNMLEKKLDSYSRLLDCLKGIK